MVHLVSSSTALTFCTNICYRSFVKNLFSVFKAVPMNEICSSESHMADGRKEYTVNAVGLL